MRHSNKITSMCTMALVLIMGYSLGGISGMNFQDRMAYAADVKVVLENQKSSQKFTLQKVTKEHLDLDSTVPKTIEPGKQYPIHAFTTNMEHDGIMHLYYTYGKDYTAEFSSWFDPPGFPVKCSSESGSSEINISCKKDTSAGIIKFFIKDAN